MKEILIDLSISEVNYLQTILEQQFESSTFAFTRINHSQLITNLEEFRCLYSIIVRRNDTPDFTYELRQKVIRAIRQKNDMAAISRKHSRYELLLPIQYSLSGNDNLWESRIRNLSFGGVFVDSSSAPPLPGAVVKFKVYAGESLAIEGEGEVAWNRNGGETGYPAGFGLKFNRLSSNSMEHLNGLIEIIELRKTD